MSGKEQRNRDEQTTAGVPWTRTLAQLAATGGVVLGGVAIAGLIIVFLLLLPGALAWLTG
ncbi:hypothetical protein BSP239C_03814 [Brevibacterium sp. 239c]|uniref:hypothetical protein n=1 Tax=Brevibacterium sp. 239c TaxID=1965356 RepID=UPI000C6BDE3B|nr:hypothetical protein [Brevibacterium sp. 239c]SMY04364.1 hypothetical protein BSP239C_03814 [Brevibacterium sp. 239c]